MTTWIALLRGINVGGKNILPMAEFRQGLETLKFRSVRTYIQSGNVVFESTAKSATSLAKSATSLAKKIGNCVQASQGFLPQVMVLDCEELLAAFQQNPFPEALEDPKTLHVFFMGESPTAPELEKMDQLKSSTEKYRLSDRVFYLYAPDGIGRSKLAAQVEKLLGVAATARNLRTVEKLLALVEEAEKD